MTTTPFRPLPVGGVPAWLLGPLSAHLQPLLHLTPSRLQIGAELIRRGVPVHRTFSSPSAAARSHTSLTLGLGEQPHEGHRSMFHHQC